MKLVSIPNGMEFYENSVANKIIEDKFQFPTGWNSTEGLYDSIKDHLSFQFPTGWNSTLVEKIHQKLFNRFNSQRDGILLIRRPHGALYKVFQFPTGWNSTVFFYSALRIWSFQSPTGWNSTGDNYISSDYYVVSIPNGMEFYTKTAWSALCFKSFNSQRDRILLSCFISHFTPHLFQFPTG